MIAALLLAQALLSAADREGVPRALLVAMDHVQPLPDPALAARALRSTADEVFTTYRDLREDRLGDWLEPLLLSRKDFQEAIHYASAVYRTLRDGIPHELAPQEFTLPWPLDAPPLLAAPNYTKGRTLPIEYLVIHDMEGTFDGTQLHFLEPSSNASAHFEVSPERLGQQVAEDDTAWQSGNGDLNAQAIGIEHEGYADQGFPDAVYRASAALTRYLCDRFHIPKNRFHIIGHYEVPDPARPGWYGGRNHHTDPCDAWAGEPGWHNVSACRWDWDRYMALVNGP